MTNCIRCIHRINLYLKKRMTPPTLRSRIKRLLAFEQAIDYNILLSVTDRDGIILSANKKFCEVSGYKEDELVGKNHNIVNSGHHSKDFFSTIWIQLLSGNSWRGEIKNKTATNTYYWADIVIVPIYEKGEITEFLSLSAVTSNSKEAEIILSEAAFTISHKIRQPYVNMQALLTFILLESEDINEIKSMARVMQAELDKIDGLTRQMAVDLHTYKSKLT